MKYEKNPFVYKLDTCFKGFKELIPLHDNSHQEFDKKCSTNFVAIL